MRGDLILLGDNLRAPGRAPGRRCFQLIYIDPPFNTGRAQHTARRCGRRRDPDGDRTGFGGRRYRTERLARLAYDDGFDDYLGFLEPRLREAHRLLDAEAARCTCTSTSARRTT